MILKGGLVVELRVARARTTQDVDLRLTGRPTELLERLRRAAELELGDAMIFAIARDTEHPQIIETPDTLAFAGIPPTSVRVYPLETHIAEKLHAHTIPRPRPNTRVKDLPDIALLAGVREIEPGNLRAALDQTFLSRNIVIQDDVFNHSRVATVIVCALTSNLKRATEPGNVWLDAGEGNLPQPSIVVVSQVSSVEKTTLGERIGSLSASRAEQIIAGLRF